MTDLPMTLGQAGAGRTRPLRGMVLCVMLCSLALALPFMGEPLLHAIVFGMLICLLVPLWYSWFRRRLDWFESVHIFGLIYFVYFGLGAIWTVHDPTYVAYDIYIVPYVPKAAFYCLLGYVTLLAGYYGPWRGRRPIGSAPEQLRGSTFLVLSGGVGIVGYFAVGLQEQSYSLGASISTAISTLGQLSPVFLFAWGLGWMLYFSKQASRSQMLVLFGFLVPGALLTALETFSDKSLLMTLIGVPIIARWYTRRKVPWVFLLTLLLILVFAIFPFYNTYRWSDPTMGEQDRMRATLHTLQTWDSDQYLRYSISSFTRRLAMINSVAIVVRDVGRWVPYAQGETLLMPTLFYFIPRAIWPDKPVTTLGRDFGRIFRVTNAATRDTYIAVTVPGEFYWNFDLPGILVGMALLGMGLRLLYRRYAEGRGGDPIRISIHILLLIQVAHLHGSLANHLVLGLRTLLVLEGMCWLGRRLGLLERGAAPLTASVGPR